MLFIGWEVHKQMENDIHKPIKHSNQPTEERRRQFNRSIEVSVIATLSFIGGGTYFLFQDSTDLFFVISLFFFGLIAAGFAYLFIYSKKIVDRYELSYELNEKGYFQKQIDHKKGTEESINIPFETIREIVVGNNVNKRDKKEYYLGALMVLKHEKDEVFFREFFDESELNDWISRYQDKGCPLFKTEYDLYPAYMNIGKYDVDFNKLHGEAWDGKSFAENLGARSRINPYQRWEPSTKKIHEDTIKKQKKKYTKKWEIRIGLLLLGYALIIGSTVMPWLPLNEDGSFWKENILFTIGVVGVNMLTPLLFVFWRPYTHWFIPLIYFGILFAGNSVAVCIVSLFADVPGLYMIIFALNLLILLISWIPGYIIIKTVKGIIALFRKVKSSNDEKRAA